MTDIARPHLIAELEYLIANKPGNRWFGAHRTIAALLSHMILPR
jgi:hypothetical protein